MSKTKYNTSRSEINIEEALEYILGNDYVPEEKR